MDGSLISAVKYIWLNQDPESLIKQAAALFLLKQPGCRDTCVRVASFVAQTVGTVASLAINKSFEQVVGEDPCFDLDKSQANAHVSLNTSQVLLQFQWKQDEQQQLTQLQLQLQEQHHQQQEEDQGLQPPHAPSAGSGSYIRATPKLLQGLNEVWPLSGPAATGATKVKHKACYHLLQTPQHRCTRSVLANTIKETLGRSVRELGCTKSFAQLLQEEADIFMVVCHGSEGLVSLNRAGVLDRFVRRRYHQTTQPQPQQGVQHVQVQAEPQQEQQPLSPLRTVLNQQLQEQAVSSLGQPPATTATAAAAAAPGVISAAQLLQFVQHRCWHSDVVLDAARRALAVRMIIKANPAAGQQPANSEAKRYSLLAPTAGYAITKAMESLGPAAPQCRPSLEQTVDQDPYLSIHLVGDMCHVKLDVQQLLEDAAAASAAAATPIAASEGAADAATSSTQLQQQEEDAADNISSSSSSGDLARWLLGLGDTASSQCNGATRTAGLGVPVEVTQTAATAATAAAAGNASDAGGTHTATGAAGRASVSVLLQQAQSRVWHKSSTQLDVARRALAVQLVKAANPGPVSEPVNLNTQDYRCTFDKAGIAIHRALRSHFGSGFEPSFRKIAEVFQGDPCWTIWHSGASVHQSVRLNIHRLLKEVAKAQGVFAGAAASAYGAPSAGISSGAAGDGVRAAGAEQQRVRPASAASSGEGSSKQPGAAVESAGMGAAEAAAAAIRAAAKSLMPPAARSLGAAGAAAGQHLALNAREGDSSQGQAPGSAAAAAAAAAAEGLRQPVSFPPAAASRPFFPPWLLSGRTTAVATYQLDAAATQQQQASVSSSSGIQQQQAADGDGNGDTGVFRNGLPLQPGNAEQQQAVASGVAAAAVAGPDVADVPLQYELQLCQPVPGWYTATFVCCSSLDVAGGSSMSGSTAADDDTTAAAAAANGPAGSEDGSMSPSERAGDGETAAQDMNAAASDAASGADTEVQHDSAAAVTATAVTATSTADTHSHQPKDVAAVGDTADVADAAQNASSHCVPDPGADGSATDSNQEGCEVTVADGETMAGVAGGTTAGAQAQGAPTDLQGLWQVLPPRLHSVLHPHLPQPDASAQPQLTHILIDREQPVTLRLSNRTSITLPTPLVTLEEALQHLMAAAQHWEQQLAVQPENNNSSSSSNGGGGGQEAISPVNGDVSGHKQGSSSSIKPAAEQPDSAALQAAAQTLFSSSSSSSSGCVGVPGSVHHVAAVFDGAGQVTGLTYRLQHHVQGAALGLADVLTAMKASLMADSGRDKPRSLLVVGRPGAGKSRLLCDVCRLMSEGPEQGGLGLHVLLLDTTGQVAGLSSRPSPHIGPTRRLWVGDPTQQGQFMRQAVLQHAPDVLVVDELSSPQDVAAAVAISRSLNMLLVAGVPVINLQGLVQDDTFSPLAGCERRSGQPHNDSLWTPAGNSSSSRVEPVRPPIAAAVLELEPRDKWRLHTDLQASITSLLAQGASVIGDSSGRQQPQLDTQLRSRAADGRLLVEFSSAEAVHSALADAALLRDVAGRFT